MNLSAVNAKKVVIFGSYNRQSVGDKAILISIIDLLFRTTSQKIIIEIICFDADAIEDELSCFPWAASVNVVNFLQPLSKGISSKKTKSTFFKKLMGIVPLRMIQDFQSLKFYFQFKPKFNTDADLVIIGGGNLLMDIFPSWLVMPYLITKKFKCPYVIAGVGAFPIKTKLGDFIIKKLLENSALNYVRDKQTFDLVKNDYKLDCNLHPDFAFSYPYPVNSISKDIQQSIAVNIAPIYGEQWPYKDSSKYAEFIKIIAESLYNRVLSKDNTTKLLFFDSNYPTDRAGALDVIAQLRAKGVNKERIIYPDKLLKCFEIVELIKDAKYCIVTRLHAGILAIDASVPVLGIAYQPKVKAVFESVGLTGNVIDINKIHNFESFLEKFSKSTEKFVLSESFKNKLKRENELVAREILQFLNKDISKR